MLVRLGYDGHPDSWGLVIVAETEAEAGALHAWVKLSNNGCTLKIGLAANDFTCPEPLQRSRIFRIELIDKKGDEGRIGFVQPRPPMEVEVATPWTEPAAEPVAAREGP